MVSTEEFRRLLSPPPVATSSEPIPFVLTLNLNAYVCQSCPNCGTKMQLRPEQIEKVSGFAYQKKESYGRKTAPTPIAAMNEGTLEL